MQFVFWALISLIPSAAGHSWIEILNNIAPNGTFVGSPGYPRGFISRNAPQYSDTLMMHALTGSNVTIAESSVCKSSESEVQQRSNYPRLKSAPGGYVAMRYQENGHVTQPWIPEGHPPHAGHVYVYGTTQPKANEKMGDVYQSWNKEGSGGDKRGVLLTTFHFDDGRCHQVNPGAISQHRIKIFPHKPDKVMGTNVWCQQDIKLPDSLPDGKLYTLYWIWNWPRTQNGQTINQMYTSCMDIDIVGPDDKTSMKYVYNQDLNTAADPLQLHAIESGKATEPDGDTQSDSDPVPQPGQVPPDPLLLFPSSSAFNSASTAVSSMATPSTMIASSTHETSLNPTSITYAHSQTAWASPLFATETKVTHATKKSQPPSTVIPNASYRTLTTHSNKTSFKNHHYKQVSELQLGKQDRMTPIANDTLIPNGGLKHRHVRRSWFVHTENSMKPSICMQHRRVTTATICR